MLDLQRDVEKGSFALPFYRFQTSYIFAQLCYAPLSPIIPDPIMQSTGLIVPFAIVQQCDI